MTTRDDTALELRGIQDQMLDLLRQARSALRSCDDGGTALNSASAYWLAHIETALTNDHGYLGGSMVTMQDTIEALEQPEEIDEDAA